MKIIMRVLSVSAASLTSILVENSALAFTPPINNHHQSTLTTTTTLNLDATRLKNAGAGVTTNPPGNLSVFDPNQDGKLQGTDTLSDRISSGALYTPPSPTPPQIISSVPPSDANVQPAQHFLEYLDETPDSLPLNFAKPQSPAVATVLGRTKLITEDAPGDIEHVILRLPTGFHYVEGQSLSVIPPGNDPKTGRKHKPRLYSIASTRYGDLLDGTTISLCVRRAEYVDPTTGTKDPEKQGVCSNFLCDIQPGQEVQVAGPVGKTMLLPKDPNTDVIMIATGTGIAPFRGFLHRLFMENTLAKHIFGGTAWLVLGVPVTGGLLYKEEFDCMLRNAPPGQLKVNYAISREMTNAQGGKLYVQNVIAENGKEFFDRLKNGANVYFCGLKGMMPPILETMEQVAAEQGVDWDVMLSDLKKNHQWHVEVY